MIERKDVVPMFKVTDMMDVIKEERNRIERIVNSEEFPKKPLWGWMLEWVEKSDEEHLSECMEITKEDVSEKDLGNYVCHICFAPNRFLLRTTFPVGDGWHGHTMQVCSQCGKKIGELAEQLNLLEKK